MAILTGVRWYTVAVLNCMSVNNTFCTFFPVLYSILNTNELYFSSKCAHVCFLLTSLEILDGWYCIQPTCACEYSVPPGNSFQVAVVERATRRQHFFVPSSGCPSIRASLALGLWITGRVPGEAAAAPVVTSLLYSIHLCVVGVEFFMLQIYITLRMFRFFSQIESEYWLDLRW